MDSERSTPVTGRVSSPSQDALMELVEVAFRIRPRVSMWHRSGMATKVELSWEEFKALSLAALSAHHPTPPNTCECGRSFDKRMGLHVHTRQCPVEKRRSEVHVDGYAGSRGWDAVAAWRQAGRP